MIGFALALLAQAITPPPAPVTGARTPQEIYEKRCTVCHGGDGKGKTKKGRQLKAKDFTRSRFQQHTTDKEIVDAITNGIKKRKMPAFKDKLSPEEIQALVGYVRAFGKK
jgi:mono/diheme cytochrome c family protein